MDHKGCVLVIGDAGLAKAIEFLLDLEVGAVRAAAQTEGIGVDVVVVAGDYPMPELTEVRVHPRLYDRPVVLVAPGHELPRGVWRAIDVWPVTRTDPEATDEVKRTIAMLLARSRHPSAARERREVLAS